MPSPPPRQRSAHRWLIFVHQLPSHPSNLRVRTWRRFQQLGAIAVKQAVYVLPDSPAAREDFEWLRAEVEGAGGEAAVFAADHVDQWSGDALIEEFRRASEKTYAGLARDVQQVLRRLKQKGTRGAGRTPAVRRRVEQFRQRLAAARTVDFFGAPGGNGVLALIDDLESQLANPSRPSPGKAPGPARADGPYRAALWVTRPRPGVDRMASAWLIRRFVDPDARFDFVPDRERAPAGAVPFDMFGVEITHHGAGCTFEVLCDRFGIRGPAVQRLAGIVHDLDLKDQRFGAAGADIVGMVIEGLQLAHEDDHALLSQGIALFEALYRSFEHRARQVRAPGAARRAAAGRRVPSRRRRR